MASVTGLPAELLFEITAYLDWQNDHASLVPLALTCRRFYDFFMPAIHEEQSQQFNKLLRTQRLSITSASVDPSIKDASDEDSNLQLSVVNSTFRKPIACLAYAIGSEEKELQSVLGVISREKYIEQVQLELGYSSNQRRVARFMNVCVATPHLGLTVRGGIPALSRGPFKYKIATLPIADATGVTKNNSNNFFKSLLAFFTRPFRLAAAEPQSPVAQTDPPSVFAIPASPKFNFKCPPHPQLSSFAIQSDGLFLPSLYPVTLNALNHSPIHTLSMSDMTLTLYDWSHILPAITMPFLKTLSISTISIAFPDLLAFLDRHASIETLDFTENYIIGVVKFHPEHTLTLLPRLTSLTAYCGYLIPFMQHKQAGHFPHLRNLSINGPTYDLDVLYNLLSEGGLENLSVTLHELPAITFVEWILGADVVDAEGGGDGDGEPEFEFGRRLLVGVVSLIMHVSRRKFDLALTESSKRALERWESGHTSLVVEGITSIRTSDGYLRIFQALVSSISPQLKEFAYCFM